MVMRSSINVKYYCDCYTGAGLVEISAMRDGNGGVVYTFSCDLAAKYPLSQGSYMGIVGSIATLATGILGGGITTAGAISNVMRMGKFQTELSGNFTGNSGAMSIKKPYLVIIRPQTNMADQYLNFDGAPANYTVKVGECSGYVKAKEAHLKIEGAYESEITLIEQLLYTGILI